MIDSANDPTGGSSVFETHDTGGTNADGTNHSGGGQDRDLVSGDRPGFGLWLINHKNTHNPWGSTQGGYDFTVFVAAYSSTFPDFYGLLAKGSYTVRLVGSSISGTWTDSGSTVTVSGATGGTANLTIMGSGGSPATSDSNLQVRGNSYTVHHAYAYAP
jgi:hypothetical protein